MILNLINLEKSEIKYEVSNFPDGHKHLKITTWLGKPEKVTIKCRLTNGDDLFLLLQAATILNDLKFYRIDLEIFYLLAARCDWKFSWGEAADVRIIGDILNNIINFKNITVLDPHCSTTFTEKFAIQDFDYKKYTLCFPDKGAGKRLSFINPGSNDAYIFDKVRKDDGSIEVTLPNPPGLHANKKPILVVDDLCDGGGTFVEIRKKLHREAPIFVHLFVTHAIQLEGIKRVAEVYDKVFITNSYKDWENEKLPSNVEVIEL
jgi:ribose-phosphate pyrophosphokinase